jgi:hypothetical protein
MYFKVTKKEIVDCFTNIEKRIEEKRIQLLAIAKSYNAELFTYNSGRVEYCEFAGLQFKDKAPKGFCKPDHNGMQKPYQRNREFWDKINKLPSAKIQDAMNLLNFPARGIYKYDARIDERNFLISINWQVSKDKTCIVFHFPDKYLSNCKPMWTPPEYAIEILASEFNKITEAK